MIVENRQLERAFCERVRDNSGVNPVEKSYLSKFDIMESQNKSTLERKSSRNETIPQKKLAVYHVSESDSDIEYCGKGVKGIFSNNFSSLFNLL